MQSGAVSACYRLEDDNSITVLISWTSWEKTSILRETYDILYLFYLLFVSLVYLHILLIIVFLINYLPLFLTRPLWNLNVKQLGTVLQFINSNYVCYCILLYVLTLYYYMLTCYTLGRPRLSGLNAGVVNQRFWVQAAADFAVTDEWLKTTDILLR